MVVLYLWCGGLGGALLVLGAMWIREKVDDMEDSVETLDFEIVRLREELKKYGERIRDYEE